MPQITLNLSLEQTNMVLEALGQLPYVRVYELIETIGRQAAAQVQAPSVEAEQARLTPVRSA
jgi:hypothetical protein